ncbi:hypothetical protein KBD59_01255 [Candidatus Gracilibacteria bacterium]|nr:hypothetical protein [Candidatus Gracilibacteria bacterium]
MKKTISLIVLCVALSGLYIPAALAQATERKAPSIENILPKTVGQREDSGKQSLPTGNLKTEIVPTAIKMFLGFMGVISFVIFLYGGVMLVVAQGNEEEIGKFKKMLLWSVVGLVIILASYGIVDGVARLITRSA